LIHDVFDFCHQLIDIMSFYVYDVEANLCRGKRHQVAGAVIERLGNIDEKKRRPRSAAASLMVIRHERRCG
jgi:hypothetical protein